MYQATEGGRTTLLFVSGEGILLIDPLNVEFAQWLKDELDQRFPGQPVRYVVYTRHDFDRAGGGTHYNTTAEIVAADGFQQRLKHSRDVLPPRLAALDRQYEGGHHPTLFSHRRASAEHHQGCGAGLHVGADFAVPLGARL